MRAKTHRLLPVRCCRKKEGSRGPGGVARGSQKFPRLRKFYPDAPGGSGQRECSPGAPKSGPPGEPIESRFHRQKLCEHPAARRFFLPGARLFSSSAEWPAHRVLKRAFQVFVVSSRADGGVCQRYCNGRARGRSFQSGVTTFRRRRSGWESVG